jgi:hypothetical protein
VLSFKVTPSQSIALKTFYFCGLSVGEVGTGVLPPSIIPPEATSTAAVRATASNHANAEIYDISGDPSGGALSTVDTQRLRNQKGYIPDNWGEARVQLRCNLGLIGALCGDGHGVTVTWGAMLRRFERVESRLQHQLDLEYRVRLNPGLFVFHLQLIFRDWFEEQTRTGQQRLVPPPDFAEHIHTFERQNNLRWVPSVSNVPALHALRLQPRTANAPPAPRGHGVARETGTPRPAPADLGARVRNPSRDARFTGSTAFATNVRERRVDEAIIVGGGREAMPKLTRNGVAE